MASRTVRFDDTQGGSRHHRNDSGVGSLSDYDTRDADVDRDRRKSIPALHVEIERLRDEKEDYKRKAHFLDTAVTDLRRENKDLKISIAVSQGLANRNELLEQENHDLKKDVRKLQEANNSLEERLLKALKKMDKLMGTDSSPSPPPVMRGGSGEPSPEKMKRRMSKSYKGTEAEKEKEKLLKRFDRAEQSDTSNSTGKSSGRRRRESYIEPMGQSAPRPPVPMPPSPTRQFPAYSTTQQHAPQFTNIAPPVVGKVARSVHPTVTYSYEDQNGYGDRAFEDGNYNVHPLPSGGGRR